MIIRQLVRVNCEDDFTSDVGVARSEIRLAFLRDSMAWLVEAMMFAFSRYLLPALLCGCVYFPNTTTRYDEKCQTYQRHMTLEVQQVGNFVGCHGEACVGALVVMGAVSASTAVVSGSVVVVGNAVYWIEKQGRCLGLAKKSE